MNTTVVAEVAILMSPYSLCKAFHRALWRLGGMRWTGSQKTKTVNNMLRRWAPNPGDTAVQILLPPLSTVGQATVSHSTGKHRGYEWSIPECAKNLNV